MALWHFWAGFPGPIFLYDSTLQQLSFHILTLYQYDPQDTPYPGRRGI